MSYDGLLAAHGFDLTAVRTARASTSESCRDSDSWRAEACALTRNTEDQTPARQHFKGQRVRQGHAGPPPLAGFFVSSQAACIAASTIRML